MKKNALGKGLGALIDDSKYEIKKVVEAINTSNEIEISRIKANPYQPRTDFENESLQELANSILKLGLIQPVTVSKIDSEFYQLISGERRLRASKLAGLTKIPSYVIETDNQGLIELALVENIQRLDLNPMEIAISYKRLIDECKITQEEVGERVGKNRTSITNYLGLLNLPAEIQASIRDGQIGFGHAKAMNGLDDLNLQFKLYNLIISQNLSARKAEEIAKELKENIKKDKTDMKVKLPAGFQQVEKQMAQRLNAKVQIQRTLNGKGKIVIPFNSDDEFARITEVLHQK